MSKLIKLFDLVPGVVYALLIAVLMQTTSYFHAGMLKARAAFAQQQAQLAQATANAEKAARLAEQAMQTRVETLSQDHAQKQNILALRAADAGRAADRLRSTIANLNNSEPATDPQLAACTGQASTARHLLGQCADRYQSLAASADQLSLQVTGLQDFLAATCHRSD